MHILMEFFFVKKLACFMLIEAALLHRNLSSVSLRTFVIPIKYGSGTGTVINYGSGSAKAKSSGP
jgi:hypothetical protein